VVVGVVDDSVADCRDDGVGYGGYLVVVGLDRGSEVGGVGFAPDFGGRPGVRFQEGRGEWGRLILFDPIRFLVRRLGTIVIVSSLPRRYC